MKYRLLPMLIFATIFSSCGPNLADKQTGKIPSSDSTSIYYERVGNGKIPIVLIHGWCIDHQYWDATVNELKDEYTVLTMDLGGHGQSGTKRKNYTIPLFADDVLAAMDKAGVAKGILVGHSMAGNIMLAIHEKAPNRVIGMIGVDNFKQVGMAQNDTAKREFDKFIQQMKGAYEASASYYVDQFLFAESAEMDYKNRVLKSVVSMPKDVAISSLQNTYEYGLSVPSRLEKLNQPLQIISCNYQPADTSALNQLMDDNYALYEMSCPGHYPMIQRPVAFNRNLKVAIESLNY